MWLCQTPAQRPEMTCLVDTLTELEAVLSAKMVDRDRFAKHEAIARVGATHGECWWTCTGVPRAALKWGVKPAWTILN